jgi:hypothetical protein
MPYRSKAQMRAFFAKEERGELPKGTAEKWAKHTPDISSLPEHVKKASIQLAFAKLAQEIMEERKAFPKPPQPTIAKRTPESVADFRGADNDADEVGGAVDTGVTPMQQYGSV